MYLDRTQSVAWPQRCCLLRRLHLREHDPTPDNPSESPSHPSFIISFSHPYHHPTHLSCNPQVCRWLVYSSPLYFSFSPSFLGRGMAGLFPTLFRVQGLYEATALPALLSCGSCQHSGMSLKPESLQSSALSPCSDDQRNVRGVLTTAAVRANCSFLWFGSNNQLLCVMFTDLA